MTVSDVYATRSDLYDYGFQRGLLANPGRLCASVLAATDTFELDGHGFSTDHELLFRAEAGGTLPAPIVAGVTMYAIPVNDQMFKVAASPAGGAVDLTTDGTAVVVATPLPFDKTLEYYSRWVDGFLPAHAVPLKPPYPPLLVGIVAKLAAAQLLIHAGQTSASMRELEIDAKAQVERWREGTVIRDARASSPTNLAYSESVSSSRGWPSGSHLP